MHTLVGGTYQAQNEGRAPLGAVQGMRTAAGHKAQGWAGFLAPVHNPPSFPSHAALHESRAV